MAIFWNLTPSSLVEIYSHFGRSVLPSSAILKIEAACLSETHANFYQLHNVTSIRTIIFIVTNMKILNIATLIYFFNIEKISSDQDSISGLYIDWKSNRLHLSVVPGFLFPWVKWSERDVNHFLLTPRLRMSEAILPFLPTPSWSVRDNFYLLVRLFLRSFSASLAFLPPFLLPFHLFVYLTLPFDS